ncbi:MAG: mechanosensitive ion channel [Synergistaceae bacterium]|nr:mechanosensitive ion channel [Synergistaceae bacterium]
MGCISWSDIRKKLLLPTVFSMGGMFAIMFFPLVSAYLSPGVSRLLLRILKIAVVGFFTWMFIGGISLLEVYFENRFDLKAENNLEARKVRTQFMIFKRLLLILVILLGASAALLSIEEFRRIGTSLLASVGIAGIVVGVSAQKTVGTFLAGIHLALAQPIRIDDVIVAEGEWGRVEEINFTFVMLRLWDLRRLVLPTTYFLEKPFQNWTRSSTELIAASYIHVDFRADMEEIRKHFLGILKSTSLWNGKSSAIQVTETNAETMELRAIMSVENSSAAWDIRCLVREKMISWLRDEHPDWLPRVRMAKPEDEKKADPADKLPME